MEYLVNAEEMKRCDRTVMEIYKMPSMVLMERAALAVLEELPAGGFDLRKILVVCGSGNNGGDGFAIARLLFQKEADVTVLFLGKESSLTEETRKQKEICQIYGVKIVTELPAEEYTTIIDALLGVGLTREVSGRYKEAVEYMNHAGAKILAVDIATGVDADSGKILGAGVKADQTVTFGFRKLGQVLYPGADHSGQVVVKDIGIGPEGFQGDFPKVRLLDPDTKKLLPVRRAYSNKGTFGRGLLVAGKQNMSGAAYLSAKAAYKMGTGLVGICTEECNRTILQTLLPEAVLTTYEENGSKEMIKEVTQWADAIGIGPGFGTGANKLEMLKGFLEYGKGPFVLDADALNLVSVHMELLRNAGQEIIVTPHVGEMARLTGKKKEEILADLPGVCLNFAKEYGVVCVLKDTRTVISDGEQIVINVTGNDGMATGGSGDVLTGMITGLLAQGLSAFDSARLAVYLHGRAGDLAREKCGACGMLAGDILQEIQEILK